MKKYFSIAGAVAAVVILVLVVAYAAGGLRWISAPFWGGVQAEVQLESGPSRISLYNRFFDLCAGVQAIEGQIDAQVAGRNDPQIVAGLHSRRAQVIADYNADAAKEYTNARFLGDELPDRLSLVPYDGSNKTICSL